MTSSGIELGQVDIKTGIFPGDALAQLPFLIIMRPLTLVQRRIKVGDTLQNNMTYINHHHMVQTEFKCTPFFSDYENIP